MNTKYYINVWKYKFNKRWNLYKITESEFEFDENIIIIEDYFQGPKKMYINKFQYILVAN
jgi:hypothetical protein